MDESEKLIYELADVNNGLLIKLRFGSDIDDEIIKQMDRIRSIMKNLSRRWCGENYLPKKLCGIFVDFFPGIESCLPNYDKETSDKLLMFADEIMCMIRICCECRDVIKE